MHPKVNLIIGDEKYYWHSRQS